MTDRWLWVAIIVALLVAFLIYWNGPSPLGR